MDSGATNEIGSAALVKAWLWWEGARGGLCNDEVTPGGGRGSVLDERSRQEIARVTWIY